MKLNKVKIAVLAAVAIIGLLSISAFAACPPGSKDLTAEPTGGNAVAAGVLTINDSGTYCVPVGGAPGAAVWTTIVVASNDVTIVGEKPDATITGPGAGGGAVITVNNNVLHVVLKGFTLVTGGGGDDGLNVAGQETKIEQVVLDDGAVAANAFPNYAIQLTGYKPTVKNCTFKMTQSNVPAINLNGGMSAQILNNTVIGAGSNPSYFIANGGANAYNDLLARGNKVNYADSFIGGGAFTNSVIQSNNAGILNCAADNGFSLGASTNVVVAGNTFIYDASGTAGSDGINIAAAATNIKIAANTITAGSAGADDCVFTAGTNIEIGPIDQQVTLGSYTVGPFSNGNKLDARIGAGDGIEIQGVTTTVKGNHIEGTRGGHGILVVNGATNAVLEGNKIENITNGNHGIQLDATNAVVKGNTIDGVEDGGNGIDVTANGGNEQIGGSDTGDGNIIKRVDDGVGIDLNATNNNHVVNNEILSVGRDGIYCDGDNNEIRGNVITRAGLRAQDANNFRYAGIRIGSGAAATNNKVTGNELHDIGGGTWAVGLDIGATPGSDNNTIGGNTINGFTRAGDIGSTAIGILVRGGMNDKVENNTVSNTGSMQVGIDIRTPDQFELIGNTVEGMTFSGLYLRGGTVTNPLKVENNHLKDNATGIHIGAGAANLESNTIMGGYTALLIDEFGVATQYEFKENCIGLDSVILVRNKGTGQLDLSGNDNKFGAEPVDGTNSFGDVKYDDPVELCPGVPSAGKTHTYGAVAGWYMVSVPLNSGTAADLFGTTAYTYDPATGHYVAATNIEPSKGYWVYLPASKSVTDSGSQVTSDVTIDISTAGWWQISAPWSYPKSAIQVIKGSETKSWAEAVSAGWIRDQIYGYTAVDGNYTTPSTLDPWYGYWVKAQVDGLSLKLLYASGTPVSTSSISTMSAPLTVAPQDLPPLPPAPQAVASQLVFGNYPNPVTDVHTTTFAVKGAAAELVSAIKVEIYDLSGRLVYSSGEVAGTSVDWHTDNDYGEYLANGVYLYKMYAEVAGQWVVSKVKKLVILR